MFPIDSILIALKSARGAHSSQPAHSDDNRGQISVRIRERTFFFFSIEYQESDPIVLYKALQSNYLYLPMHTCACVCSLTKVYCHVTYWLFVCTRRDYFLRVYGQFLFLKCLWML